MAQRTFLGHLRLAALLVVLAFVAIGAWLDRARSTDWDEPLRVTIYPIPAGGVTEADLADIEAADFDATRDFFTSQAETYGVRVDPPFQFRISHAARAMPPQPPAHGGPLAIGWWSLKMRYWAWRVAADDPLPPPDIQAFAIYYPLQDRQPVPDSLGLSKGLLAVAHLFAGPEADGRNQIVLAHELLHTLGATDKYDPATGQPLVPSGLGDPEQEPRYPQQLGELMAGRVAVTSTRAEMPASLEQMVVGPASAREIGWLN